VLATLVLAEATGYAAGKATGTPPFRYVFQITALDVDATLTAGTAKTDVRLRLDVPSRKKWLSWYGDKPLVPPALMADAALQMRGEAAYSSPDATCAQTLEYRPSPSRPVRGDLWIGQQRSHGPLGLYLQVRKFPLAIPVPGQDAGIDSAERCGKPLVRWYDTANGTLPLRVFSRPSFTFVAHRKERFDEGGGIDSIEWTLKMTVKRLRYQRIDCRTEPGC
jgi:hypothetical protein